MSERERLALLVVIVLSSFFLGHRLGKDNADQWYAAHPVERQPLVSKGDFKLMLRQEYERGWGDGYTRAWTWRDEKYPYIAAPKAQGQR
jgi:hypothetical protein